MKRPLTAKAKFKWMAKEFGLFVCRLDDLMRGWPVPQERTKLLPRI